MNRRPFFSAAFGCTLVFGLSRSALAQQAQPAESKSGNVELRAGATYRRLFDIPVYAGEIGGAIGKWDRRGGDYLTLDLMVPGRTGNGLSVWQAVGGYRTDWRVSSYRVGFSVGLGVISMERVTSNGRLASGGIATSLFFGWDVVSWESGSLGIDPAVNVFVGDEDVLFWGPSLNVSARL